MFKVAGLAQVMYEVLCTVSTDKALGELLQGASLDLRIVSFMPLHKTHPERPRNLELLVEGSMPDTNKDVDSRLEGSSFQQGLEIISPR
jgi:hypothetical protein